MGPLIAQLVMWIVITGLIIGAPAYLGGVFLSRRSRRRDTRGRRYRRKQLAGLLRTIGGTCIILSGSLLLLWFILSLLMELP